jgi:hypothetical protein
MSELDLVVEDADKEFDALRRLIIFADNAQHEGKALSPQARLVSSNASILFIAAAFEESVRQLGLAYARRLVSKTSIPDNRLRDIKIGLWERASFQLSSKAFGTKKFDEAKARASLAVLQNFCLDLSEIQLMVDHAVYHTRNLRVDEVNALFKRLGVSEVCTRIGRSIEYRTFFLSPTVAAAQGEFTRHLNKFYEDRNSATHDLGAFRASGAVDVSRQVDFFELAVRRLAAVLDADLDTIT